MSILIISSEYYLEAGDKMGVYNVIMYSSFTAVKKQSPAVYKFNPFTAPAHKFSRLKSAHRHTCRQYT